MKKNLTRILFGILLIIAAIVLLGNSFGWWNVIDVKGWWTVFLIIPGIAGIINYGFNAWNTCLVVIGSWFLASEQNWIPEAVSDNILWICILLFIGIKLVISPFKKPRIPSKPVVLDGVKGANDSNNTINYTAVFGGMEVSNSSQSLCGGTVSAIFGGATIDLRNAVPVNGAVIEANAIFGGVDIYIPENCRIQANGLPLFGGFDCKVRSQNDVSLPLLTIKYTSILGGVEIK